MYLTYAADMKISQAEKLVKARRDPDFARNMEVKDLSPQQSANQVRLRKSVQATEVRLEELEAGISGIKKRLNRRQSGRQPAQSAADFSQTCIS